MVVYMQSARRSAPRVPKAGTVAGLVCQRSSSVRCVHQASTRQNMRHASARYAQKVAFSDTPVRKSSTAVLSALPDSTVGLWGCANAQNVRRATTVRLLPPSARRVLRAPGQRRA